MTKSWIEDQYMKEQIALKGKKPAVKVAQALANPEILRKAFGDVMSRKVKDEGRDSKGKGLPAVNHIKHI